MRRGDTIKGRKVEDRRKIGEMTTSITLPPMDELTRTELRRRYEETTDAETRTHYQILLPSLQCQTSTQITHIMLRSQDTVVCASTLLNGRTGCRAEVYRPGRKRRVTAARARRTAPSDRVGSP